MSRKRSGKRKVNHNLSANFNPPSALTKKQADYIHAIHHKELVITLGPAGTGKSFLAAAYAAYYFHMGRVAKIVLTRPTVPTGKSVGFFPGTLEEKMQPWTAPFISVLEDFLTKAKVEIMIRSGQIEIIPFEVIRGHTFNDAFVVLDEAQNSTPTEIKAFVTRQGENCTVIINGDLKQSDLNERSGLAYLLSLIDKNPELSDALARIEFSSDDVVRSGLCKLWVKAFEAE